MTLDLILFLLRIASAVVLISLMGMILYTLWRDLQSASQVRDANRRSYGRIVPLQAIDGEYIHVGEAYPLVPLTEIGRAATSTIVVADSFASNSHARVVLRGGQWWLEDQQSRNGTMLNDIPVERPVVLTDGDVIGIGEMRFRLELE